MYPAMKGRNGTPIASDTSVRSRCGAWGSAPWTLGFMSSAVSRKKMTSLGDLSAMAPHIWAGTWAKDAGAMRPKISVYSSLTLVVAHTMGRQFRGCAQSPFL